jgi:hypothetical protein
MRNTRIKKTATLVKIAGLHKKLGTKLLKLKKKRKTKQKEKLRKNKKTIKTKKNSSRSS